MAALLVLVLLAIPVASATAHDASIAKKRRATTTTTVKRRPTTTTTRPRSTTTTTVRRTTTTTSTTTSTTTVATTTTTTTVIQHAVQGTNCPAEGMAGITDSGLLLTCSTRACDGSVHPRAPRWRRAGC